MKKVFSFYKLRMTRKFLPITMLDLRESHHISINKVQDLLIRISNNYSQLKSVFA